MFAPIGHLAYVQQYVDVDAIICVSLCIECMVLVYSEIGQYLLFRTNLRKYYYMSRVDNG